MLQIKQLHKIVLAVYLLFLLWLVLFKSSSNPFVVLADHQSRSLNLIPFAGYSLRDVVGNIIIFVLLGLLLSSNFKRVSFWRKFTYMFLLSITIEVVQFALAIGATDITDVITNTLGGLLGLLIYRLVGKHMDNSRLDACITITLAILLVAFSALRWMVFRVRY